MCWGFCFAGVVIRLVGDSPLLVWVGLEINLFGITPLLRVLAGDYLLVQLVGRLLFFCRGVIGSSEFIGVIGLCVKLGVLPYFWWYTRLINRCSLVNIFVLRTLQKVHLLRLVSGSSLDVTGLTVFTAVLVFPLVVSGWGSFTGRIGPLSVLDSCVLLNRLGLDSFSRWGYFAGYSVFIGFALWGYGGGNGVVTVYSLLSLAGFPLTPGFGLKVSLLSLFWGFSRFGVGYLLFFVGLVVLCQFVGYLMLVVFFLGGGGVNLSLFWLLVLFTLNGVLGFL